MPAAPQAPVATQMRLLQRGVGAGESEPATMRAACAAALQLKTMPQSKAHASLMLGFAVALQSSSCGG